jgi:prepilin-type N-terminal cleavage/methylation domain-containing protein
MSIMQRSSQRPYLPKGFTLVEVMIVVAIIAILGAIAIPAYNGYIATSKMKSAETVIEQIPILLETYRAENGSFPPDAPLGAPYTYTETEGGVPTNNISKSVATGGAGLTDFAPRSKSYPANQGILYHYSISIANSGTVNETATFWATPQTGRGAPSGNVPPGNATHK